MTDDFDIVKMFDDDFNTEIPERPPERDSIQYKTYDMCSFQGSVIGRLIHDAKGKMFRRIDNVISGKLPIKDEDGKDATRFIRFATAENFEGHCQLTESQFKLLKDIEKLFDDHWDHFEEVLNFKLSNQQFIFYMSLQYTFKNYNEEEKTYSSPRPTVMIHRSARFLDSFKSAVNERHKARGEKEWLKNYAKREAGTTFYMTTIKTERTQGYVTTFDFQELPGRKIEIFPEDLEATKDIYAEYINVSEFNEEFYTEIYKLLKNYCDELDKSVGLADHNIDKTNYNK